MYCRWCGTEISEDSRFCGNCGKSLITEPIPPVNPTITVSHCQNPAPTGPQKQVDNTIMPLNIFCIIMCFIGLLTFFLPILEANGYDRSAMEYYTIGYSGSDLLISHDFSDGEIYGSFSLFARIAPLCASLLYVVAMYLFYTCFNYRPNKAIPTLLFVILFLGLSVSMSVNSTPAFDNSYVREKLSLGIGARILAWDTVGVLILGYVLSKKLAKTDLPQ